MEIMVLVGRLISQDHVIKKSCDFMGGTPHGKSHHEGSLVVQICSRNNPEEISVR